MNVLALDTALSACSVALRLGDRTAASRREAMERGHAEALMPMVDAVMRAAEDRLPEGFRSLDAIAVTVGPGAFTGVRIGLAAARAMAAAAARPVLGLTTLEVVAADQEPDGLPLLVALTSKRADIYVQLFGGSEESFGEPSTVVPSAIAERLPSGPVALAGDAADLVERAFAEAGRPAVRLPGTGLPDAAVLARLAADRAAQAGSPERVAGDFPARPLYLRPPDVTLPSRK